jgi:hypothetical protein
MLQNSFCVSYPLDWALPLALSNVSNLDLYAHQPAHPPISVFKTTHTQTHFYLSLTLTGAHAEMLRVAAATTFKLSGVSLSAQALIQGADKNVDRLPFKIIHSPSSAPRLSHSLR